MSHHLCIIKKITKKKVLTKHEVIPEPVEAAVKVRVPTRKKAPAKPRAKTITKKAVKEE
tara:strand:+ start:627 stop:803 length:177 start_codon:yes stop_codon:yes gene_type:complete